MTKTKLKKSPLPSEINAKADEPYAKLIFNDKAWIVFLVPEKQGERFHITSKARLNDSYLSLQIELDGINERIPVVIEQVYDKENGFCKVIAYMDK